jgi:NDP-sugar pyrophosphorylase family protein
MQPLTDDIPKALIPVLGTPFVDWQLRWLAGHGVERVTLSIGYLGHMIRDHVGDGSRLGLAVDYVDEGDALRGTAGALRLAIDQGALDDAFFVHYGDSYLPIDLRDVEAAWRSAAAPALMTVMRNENRWDASNVVLAGERVELYDKTRPEAHRDEMLWIDYGLNVLSRDLVAARVPAGEVLDLADVLRDLSRRGELAGFEVHERFYEVGSPAGLAELEGYLRDTPAADG